MRLDAVNRHNVAAVTSMRGEWLRYTALTNVDVGISKAARDLCQS